MLESPLFWVGSARDDLRSFPAAARRIAGHQLHRMQHGLDAADSKPMPSVGPGVYELRIRTRGAYRVFYVTRFAEGIYVLHAFQKKTQRTRKADIELGRQRLRELRRQRRTRD